MRRALLAALLAPAALGAQRPAAGTVADSAPALAVAHVTVIDAAAGRRLADHTVLVRRGRIAAVGPAGRVRLPAGARVLDGRGRYLILGLIDTHAHVAWVWNAKRDDMPRRLALFLGNGVTTIREASGAGRDSQLVRLRDARDTVRFAMPRLYVSGTVAAPSIKRSGEPTARALARRLIAMRVDGIKIRQGLTLDDIRAVVAEAHAAGLPVYGHTTDVRPTGEGFEYTREAVRAGVDGVMHVEGLVPETPPGRPPRPGAPPGDSTWQAWWIANTGRWAYADTAQLEDIIRTMLERGTWFEPTLAISERPLQDSLFAAQAAARRFPLAWAEWTEGFAHPVGADLALWRAAYARMAWFVRRFQEEGGTVLAGSDGAPMPGYGIHDELRLLVEAGLTPLAALRAATLDAARAMQWDDRLGSIAAGKLADLVLLDADPLADIRNTAKIRAVIAGGRLHDRAALDALLEPPAAPK